MIRPLLSTSMTVLLLSAPVFSQELVSNEPLSLDHMLGRFPVLAMRQLPVEKLIVRSKENQNNFVLDPKAVIFSALNSKELSPGVKASFYDMSRADKSTTRAIALRAESVGVAPRPVL